MTSKFYYFGFGSNMLTKRIHIQNPTAVRIGPGKLEGYRLDFNTSSKSWMGSPATIVPTKGAHVFGAIWEIHCCNLEDLDNQEGVDIGLYIPITVPVHSINCGKSIQCRAYHLTNQPQQDLSCMKPDAIPADRQPSKTYLKTIIKGAMETGICEEYVQWLRSLKHNGKMVDTMEKRLELHTVHL